MRMSLFLPPLFYLFATMGSSSSIHVPSDCSSIQEAIDAAASNDVIVVADGTYFENIRFKGKTLTLKSENGPEACIINGSMNGPVVSFDQGEGHRSIMEGFTITNGSGKTFSDSGLHYHYGGGIYIEDASPAILNNHICANRLPPFSGSTIVIEGGGLFSGHPMGGAWLGSPVIRGNEIFDNFSGGHGGGIAIAAPSLDETLLMENNMIYGNRSDANGGGVYISQFASARLLNNQIFENQSWNGGGVYCWSYGIDDACVIFHNNMIHNNTADNWGGAASFHFVGILSVNNTYADNRSLRQGGGIYFETCRGRLINDILWGNVGDVLGRQGYLQSYSGIRIFHSALEAGLDGFHVTPTSVLNLGAGIVTIHPLFEPGFQNYHILSLSPCKNAGKNTAPGMMLTDFEGERRIYNLIVDIGADEYQP
ncbi:MAG: DUF1565 domain-containing protein [Planctomycetota bacterium]